MTTTDKYIIVYWNHQGVYLFPEIAARFGLTNGARLRPDQFQAVMIANCETGIAQCELDIAIMQDFDSEVHDTLPPTAPTT